MSHFFGYRKVAENEYFTHLEIEMKNKISTVLKR